MRKTLLILIALFLTTASTLYAQESDLSGRIRDQAGQAIRDGFITLLKAGDSSIVRSAQVSTTGDFKLEHILPGAYQLRAQATGYSDQQQPVQVAGNLVVPDIVLLKSNAIGEVAVTAKKPFIERKIDRTVVNADALISNTGTTALDVIEKSPGVLVDQNGTISLKGKTGIMVFIDDKPTYLSGTELADYLRSLPSSTVDQVELMTNPPARYDAAGNAGVINIRMKKIRNKGFNGNANLSWAQGRYGRTNNALNLNYRNNKVNVFATLGYSYMSGFNDLDINRIFKDDADAIRYYLFQNSQITQNHQNYSGRVGIDYYATPNATYGIQLTGLSRFGENKNINTGRLLDAALEPDSTVVAHNNTNDHFLNGGINANYRQQLPKTGASFTADLDYLAYKTQTNQDFSNRVYLPGDVLKASDRLNGDLPALIRIYAAKADYSHPLKSGLKLDGGVKVAYTETDNIADYTRTVDNITSPDYDKSNHFTYKETISAAYVNAGKEFKRFSAQLGLRMEHTVSDGYQAGNVMKPDSAFKRQYTDLFPTAYVNYKIDSAGHHTLGLNYGRRIERPYYQDLNPFISPLDKFTYYLGNPFLKPSYVHTVELSYSYKSFVTLSLSYSKIMDNADETVEMVNDVYYNRPGNVSDIDIKSISLNGNYSFTKWLTFNLYTEVTNIHSYGQLYDTHLDTKGTFWYVQPMLQFSFKKGWTAQLDGFYHSDRVSTQFVSLARGRLNIGAAKKLTEAATIRLSFNDVFYSNVNNGIINHLYRAEANFRNVSDSRSVALSFSYRFGKTFADERKHEGSSIESEKNRVK